MKSISCILSLSLLLVSAVCFADAIGSINHIADSIPLSAGWMSVVALVIAELGMRFAPTQKAIGFLHMAAGIFRASAALLMKIADFSDKILPQNTVA